eukprot:10981542-Prorocentrum_lima.AAC.1
MTSSLVGSEMCIRDSYIYVVILDLHSDLKPSGRNEALLDGRDWNAVPVSYTHLTLPTICSV